VADSYQTERVYTYVEVTLDTQ